MTYFFLTKNACKRTSLLLFPLTLLFCQSVVAQSAAEVNPTANPTATATPNTNANISAENFALPSLLNPVAYVQLLSTKNADILISQLNSKVDRQMYNSESGIYEPIGYTTVRKEGRFRLNTVEEQIVSSNLPYLREQALITETGIREKLPTGADATLGYQVGSRTNNLIASQTSGLFHTEFTSSLVFTLKQPLLRGFGRDVTETTKKLAELDFLISKEQFKQQLFKSSLDGLNLYWQLYKNQQSLQLHDGAFKQAQDLMKNASARLKAGKISESSLLEIRSMILLRSIEYQRSKQAFFDAKLKLLSSLGSKNNSTIDLQLIPDDHMPAGSPWLAQDSYLAPADVLSTWPLYTIATLHKQQAEIKLRNLRNMNKPDLDFVMSGSGNGFAYKQGDAEREARGRKYPDWYIGFNLEVPLGGNYKASGLYAAQIERLTQAEIELESLSVSSSNDLLSAIEDSKISYLSVQQSEQDMQLQQTIYDNELRRFMLGNTILTTVIQKSNALMDAKMRHIDNLVKFEQSKTLFYIYSGQFFDHYGIYLGS